VKKLLYIIALLFLVSCAQVGSLTGGERDTTPPKLVKSTPKNGDTLFKKTRIELTFNEYIELNNLPQQLIISPLVKPFPDAELHGKTVVLTFDTLLRENTTYTLFFGDGIRDYTEKNVWNENLFVFSTGNVLDSLQISGTVKNSSSLKGEDNMMVLLYSELQDSAVSTKIPTYFTKTRKDGSFKITNIHEGNYRIFALQDMNSNYLFDLPNEKIAYSKNPIEINKNVDSVLLASFLENHKKQDLSTKKYINQQAYSIAFSEKTKNASISVNKEKLHHIDRFNDGDSAVVWLNTLGDDETVQMTIKDVDFSDTLYFKSKEAKAQQNKKLSVIAQRKKREVLPYDSLKIAFNFPLKEINTQAIELTKDSVSVPFSASIMNYKMCVFKKVEEEENLQLKLYAGAITDIYGNSNKDTVVIPFAFLDESNIGQLLLKLDIQAMSGPYVMQLIASSGEIVKEEFFSKNNTTFSYTNLMPDEYKIKLLLDENNNKIWDSGNYYQHLQPEKIIYYEKPLTVRANWEMEIQWNVIGK